jgi:hypothetical protein
MEKIDTINNVSFYLKVLFPLEELLDHPRSNLSNSRCEFRPGDSIPTRLTSPDYPCSPHVFRRSPSPVSVNTVSCLLYFDAGHLRHHFCVQSGRVHRNPGLDREDFTPGDCLNDVTVSPLLKLCILRVEDERVDPGTPCRSGP